MGKIWTLLSSPIPAAFAGAFLAWQGLRESAERTQAGIVIAVVVLLLHSIGSYLYERLLPQRAAYQNQRVVRKVLDLLHDLGKISSKQYDVWKVDLYLEGRQVRFVRSFPGFVQKVPSRSLSVCLAPSDPVRDSKLMVSTGPIGIAYSEARSVLWLPDRQRSAGENIASRLHSGVHEHCLERFGALRAAPVTDSADQSCIGVLVVSVEPAHGELMVGTVEHRDCKAAIRKTALAIFDILDSGAR